MENITYIYGLVDPRDGKIRYIGKANAPERRLQGHIANKTSNGRKREWLMALSNAGLKPRVVFLEKADRDKWHEREALQIKFFRERGMADLNIADGGQGCTYNILSETIRRRISESLKVSSRFQEHVRRMHRARIGTHLSETVRRKISGRCGRPGISLSEEHKRKISESRIGKSRKPFTDEARRNMSEAQRRVAGRRGRKLSEETRQKIVEAAKRRFSNPEERRKSSLAMRGNKNALGHKHTDETKKKMRKAKQH